MNSNEGDKKFMDNLWLDQPDAKEQVIARSGDDEGLAQIANCLIDDGFAILRGAVDLSLCDAVVAEYKTYITGTGSEIEKHKDGFGRVLRTVNFHLSSDVTADVATTDNVMRVLDFLFGEEAAIYSSLYFEYGTQQPIHRDSPFFETFPRNFFLGVWVALEDISADAGPLMYVKGGHRFTADPHAVYDAVVKRMGKESDKDSLINEALEQYYGDVIRGSESFGAPVRVPLKKGDVAIWHPQLPHGGSPAVNPEMTRRSMVFHCTPASKQVYQQDVFFSHRGRTPPPRYLFREYRARKMALSGETVFQH